MIGPPPIIYNNAARRIDIPKGFFQTLYDNRHATQYPITVSGGHHESSAARDESRARGPQLSLDRINDAKVCPDDANRLSSEFGRSKTSPSIADW
jgi:hypothetical protein